MDIKDLLGIDVIDTSGQSVGKIDTVEFDKNDGNITDIIVKLDKGLFSRDTDKIEFNKIDTIKDVVLLNIVIEK
jgi:sporulation protein YlmC with PRC-barrel domain